MRRFSEFVFPVFLLFSATALAADTGGTRMRIALPSGAVLTEAMLGVPDQWQRKLFPEDVAVFVSKYPDDSVQGVFAMKNAKIEGWAAMLYEDGRLQSLASYKDTRLHGSLKQWEENGNRLLYAEYAGGKKQGLTCLFCAGRPWLVQECDRGTVKTECLVKWSGNVPRAVPSDYLDADSGKWWVALMDFAEMSEACQKLAAIEDEMKQSEPKLKQQAAKWFRKIQSETRRKLAAEKSVNARNRILDSVESHSTEKANALNALERAAVYRSTNSNW